MPTIVGIFNIHKQDKLLALVIETWIFKWFWPFQNSEAVKIPCWAELTVKKVLEPLGLVGKPLQYDFDVFKYTQTILIYYMIIAISILLEEDLFSTNAHLPDNRPVNTENDYYNLTCPSISALSLTWLVSQVGVTQFLYLRLCYNESCYKEVYL